MEEKRIYRWYLILAILFSIINTLSVLLILAPKILWIVSLASLLVGTIWFIVNIVVFILILVEKVEKKALWLPSLYIFDMFFSFMVGVVYSILAMSNNADITMTTLTSPLYIVLTTAIPIIALIVAIKLLLRRK